MSDHCTVTRVGLGLTHDSRSRSTILMSYDRVVVQAAVLSVSRQYSYLGALHDETYQQDDDNEDNEDLTAYEQIDPEEVDDIITDARADVNPSKRSKLLLSLICLIFKAKISENFINKSASGSHKSVTLITFVAMTSAKKLNISATSKRQK